MQAASDRSNAAALVFYLFDLLYLNGEEVAPLPLIERKARLRDVMAEVTSPLHFSDHQPGHGPQFHAETCRLRLEGIVSKRADAAYTPGNRGLWLKTKCLNREEFVIVGWTDPEGSRPHLGALLLAYYTPDEKLLVYAGRAGTGMNRVELAQVRKTARTARNTRNAARHTAAAYQPLRLAARALARILAAPGACRRGHVPDLDR